MTMTMNQVRRHKVFISDYHKDDEDYKNRLVQALESKGYSEQACGHVA